MKSDSRVANGAQREISAYHWTDGLCLIGKLIDFVANILINKFTRTWVIENLYRQQFVLGFVPFFV